MGWYDKAELQIEKCYDDGVISSEELREQLRDLRAEHEQARSDAAEEAYNNY